MSDRDKLVEQHLPLVQAIAGKLKRSLGRHLAFDDLVAYGSRGLIEAASRFDPSQGASFQTFAYYRIRGAMLDGVRTMGWYSRGDYARYCAEQRATEYLRTEAERDAGRTADEPSPAPTTEGALADVAAILANVASIHLTSLEAAAEIEDEKLPPPDEDLARLQEQGRVRAAVAKLPDKERRLMELYYFGQKTLLEAGEELGLSKSWACRLHARAVTLLREALAKDER